MAETPTELQYTENHEWVRDEGGVVRIGITDHAQEQLDDVVYVDLPGPGTEIEAGQAIGEVESHKSVSDLYAPVSGVIEERNEALDDRPGLVNEDPYGEGWMLTVRPAGDDGGTELLDARTYRERTT